MKKNKPINIHITNQEIRVDQSLFKNSDLIFKFKGKEIPANFFKRFWLSLQIIFNQAPLIFRAWIVIQNNVFTNSRIRKIVKESKSNNEPKVKGKKKQALRIEIPDGPPEKQIGMIQTMIEVIQSTEKMTGQEGETDLTPLTSKIDELKKALK